MKLIPEIKIVQCCANCRYKEKSKYIGAQTAMCEKLRVKINNRCKCEYYDRSRNTILFGQEQHILNRIREKLTELEVDKDGE